MRETMKKKHEKRKPNSIGKPANQPTTQQTTNDKKQYNETCEAVDKKIEYFKICSQFILTQMNTNEK